MSLPPSSGPVGRALQTWLDSPAPGTAHDLATATTTLDPARDVLTDDDVQRTLRRLYDLAAATPGAPGTPGTPGGLESVTRLRELPPLVRARAALESAVEFELRVRTAHHVAVACERHEPLAEALVHLVDTMRGPGPGSPTPPPERHAPRLQVDQMAPHDTTPGHVLVTGNVATMFRLHPRLRPSATGFEAARAVATARSRPRLPDAARRVGLVPLPTAAATAPDAADERTTVEALLGRAGEEAPDVAADVLLGAASYLYLAAVHESRLLAQRREEDRPGDAVSV